MPTDRCKDQNRRGASTNNGDRTRVFREAVDEPKGLRTFQNAVYQASISALLETWATALVFPIGCGQAASPKNIRRRHDKKDNRYDYCVAPVMISERPEQVNYPNKNNDRRYRKAAAIKVPCEESVHKIAEAIHISPGGTSSKPGKSIITGLA
jgi:hypothetical protein